MKSTGGLYGEDDVYASPDSEELPGIELQEFRIQIISEATPVAMARIFGLLSGMSIVPQSTTSALRANGQLAVELFFVRIRPSTTDLLRRKIAQLAETISISCSGSAGNKWI